MSEINPHIKRTLFHSPSYFVLIFAVQAEGDSLAIPKENTTNRHIHLGSLLELFTTSVEVSSSLLPTCGKLRKNFETAG